MTQVSSRAAAIVPSMIRALRDQATPGCLDLGLGQADLRVCDAALEAARGALDLGRAPYAPNLGLPALRQAVGGRYGIDPDGVMITCGVQQALAVAVMGLVEPGDEVLVPDPGFPAYPNLARMVGAVPVPYALEPGTWGLDLDAIEAAMGPRTRAIILNSPGNPTGQVFERGALERLLELCAGRGVRFVSDEIYEDYIWRGEHLSPADLEIEGAEGVRVSGLSKSHHMMGWRVGWLTGAPALVQALKPMHQHLVTCAPTLPQIAGVAALGVHEEVVARNREIFAARRALALERCRAVDGLEVSLADGAFYLFLGVHKFLGAGERSLDLALELLREHEVVVIPGEGFGPAGDGHVRLAYTIERDALSEALDRLVTFLQGRRVR